MTYYAKVTLLFLCWLVVISIVLAAQSSPSVPLKPTEIQQLRLEKLQAQAQAAQANAQLAQERATTAQQAFGTALNTLLQECKAIIAVNHWPEGSVCDPNTLTFIAPQSKPKPAANTPPAPAAKKELPK